jgi:hypothetical protein
MICRKLLTVTAFLPQNPCFHLITYRLNRNIRNARTAIPLPAVAFVRNPRSSLGAKRNRYPPLGEV